MPRRGQRNIIQLTPTGSGESGNPIISDDGAGATAIDPGTGDTAGIPVIDPATLGTGTDAGNSGGGTGKRRGRPPGSGRTAAQKSTPKNLTETIAGSLFGLHMFAAGLLECKELALDKDEAQNLAEGIRGVADQYAMELNPRTIAWGNLMMICAMVYGPRIVAMRMNAKEKAAKTPAPLRVMEKTNPNPAPAQTKPMTPSEIFGAFAGVVDL